MLAFEQQVWSEAQNKLIAAREIMDVLFFTYNFLGVDENKHLIIGITV